MKSVIQDKLEPDFTLESEVDRNWKEIVNQWYKFDRLQKDVEVVKTITGQEVRDWLQRYTVPGKNYRKLTVKV
jgi:secreted Zn-dependent insulinase-like peptidase